MELRQPDHQIIAAEMVTKGDTATIRGPYRVGKRSERIFADSCRRVEEAPESVSSTVRSRLRRPPTRQKSAEQMRRYE
jgi:hypothetical protein